ASGARGIIVTARSDDPAYDFVSRFFAPLLGINEDPVTGSAHCYLAPYWEARLGKVELQGWQASARGGAVGCERAGERVLLRGQAVTVLRGELAV
ncbi:MAG: PhzF family phenazine biosynthesis protein, partial [Anaerolineae bacterium]